MSLRFRLSAIITMIFLVVFLAGAILVLHHAHRAVAEESRSIADLTLQLLDLAFGDAGSGKFTGTREDLIRKIGALDQFRHLHVALLDTDNRSLIDPQQAMLLAKVTAPHWFVELVHPGEIELRRELKGPNLGTAIIVIRADPTDEIREAWEESSPLLLLLLVCCAIANSLVYITIGSALRPINSILAALDCIVRGHYKTRIPPMDLPELQKIGERFNRMAMTLQNSREENRLLTRRFLAVQEQERRRLAHELHDEMGQSISAIKAVAVAIRKHVGDSESSIHQGALTISDISSRIYNVVRGMVSRLRPVILDELGLISALQDIVDDWNSHHGDAFCRFLSMGEFGDLSEIMGINIYRITQEALTNVARHAAATNVEVQLRRQAPTDLSAGSIVLDINDDGKGMDLSHPPKGFGLLGLRERIEALNGELRLASMPGKGTNIHIQFPLGEGVEA